MAGCRKRPQAAAQRVRVRVLRAMRREVRALRDEHAQRDEARRAHAGERDAPVERGGEREAHERRERVAQVAADAVRRVRVAQAARRDVRVEDREVARMEDTVAHAHQRDDREQPVGIRRERRDERAAGGERQAAEQHRPRAEAVDDEARGELRDAAAGVEHADQQAQQRPRHVELRPQDREQRREGQLEEMRERVGDADEADDAHVATERLRGCGFQGRGRRARRAGL
ncbi:MAG: hypothetical protein U1F48_06395 [Burkholderiales bacterium]